MAMDIVCGMEVKSPSKYFVHFNNNHYEFCSEDCKNKFIAKPDRYIEKISMQAGKLHNHEEKHSDKKTTEPTYKISSDGIEKITITITALHYAAGVNLEETASCTEEVIFSDFNKKAVLTPFKTIPIELQADKPGEYEFRCGMGMIRGKLIVK